MTSTRLDSLRKRHAALEAALMAELRRPVPQSEAVRALKRRKLALKDEMAAIERMRGR